MNTNIFYLKLLKLPFSWVSISLSIPLILGCVRHLTPSVSESRVQPISGTFHSENKIWIKQFLTNVIIFK